MIKIKKNKPRVIIFNPSIEDGGVEKNLFLISNYLVKKDFNVSVISSDISKKKNFLNKVNFVHSNYFVRKNSGRYIKYLSCIITLIKLLIIQKNCIILSFQANIYCTFVAILFNKKIITRLNTAPQGWDHNYIKNLIYSFFIKRADVSIVNSLEFKKEVDKRFLINSIFINNPFDFYKIKKLSKYRVKYPLKKKLNLINVGRLTDQKDQITIIKSLIHLKNLKNISLLILGKGSKKKVLIEFIKKNKLSKNVKLIGYKKNPYPYIDKADIFILSSKYEGSPNVLIEAQFLNKFIISTDCPTGPKEILKNYKNSKLFKVGNAKQLALLIDNYKFNKKRKIFKELKNYEVNFNCKKYIKLIEKIHNDID